MKNKFMTLAEIAAESIATRAELENARPGCTAHIPRAVARAEQAEDLTFVDQVLTEREALCALKGAGSPNPVKKPIDQSEALASHSQLVMKSRSLATALEAATGKKIAEPKMSHPVRMETLFAEIAALESHCDLLQGEINAACKPKVAVTPPATAATSPVTAPAAATGVEKKPVAYDPDAEILKARGYANYTELNTGSFVHRELGLRKGD